MKFSCRRFRPEFLALSVSALLSAPLFSPWSFAEEEYPIPSAPDDLPSMPAENTSDASVSAPPPSSDSSDNSDSAESTSQVDERDLLDPRIPRYTQMRPHWGFQLSGSPQTFKGERGTSSPLSGKELKSLSIQGDYQPESLQGFGVLGFGPSLAVYIPGSGVTKKAWNLWSVGGQIRYQARYFREQPIVPIFAYEFELWNYLVSARSGRFWVKGPVVGAWLLLNWLDRPSSNSFYGDHGVMRSYLVAEIRMMSGKDTNISLTGRSYFFGLRLEL